MQTTADGPLADHDERRRWWALIVLCAGMLMIILDQTIVNVALPAIQGDLDFSQSSLAWVVNAYMIPFGGLLLLAGRVGDLVGRKRVFVGGLSLFVAAIETGLAILPVALVIGVLSLGFSARLDARFGARNVLPVGLGFIVVGLLMLSQVPVSARWVSDFLPLTIVLGIGAGLTIPALTSLAMSAGDRA